MKSRFRILFYVLSVVYPVAVFVCLVVFRVQPRVFSLFVVFVALVSLLAATGNRDFHKNARLFVSAALMLLAGIICLITGRTVFIKLYPVIMNGIFLFTFGATLFIEPNICFRFACLADKKLKTSLAHAKVEQYCEAVTIAWCVFFVFNGLVAAYTVFAASDRIWSLYNGGISYLLIGILFAVEFLIRKVVNSKMPKSIPISKFNASSRKNSVILCYEGKWSDKKYLTWNDFLIDTAKLRKFIKSSDAPREKWILHCEDYWFFLCALVALLQCKKQVLLTANISPNFIAEIRTDSSIGFLTDQTNKDNVGGLEIDNPALDNTDFIPAIIKNASTPSETEKNDVPQIDADETKIIMYTSGTTGHPKSVNQRLTEFEADNAFVLSKWGDEFLARKLCATVSQHHIYGLLFTILLPFAAAVPFRRKRIFFPQELESLDDEKYMIIAVPAFLKRATAEREGVPFTLAEKDCFIFTSGGVLLPEVASESEKIFGFCPLEIYGSTETSGIAYRKQTEDGQLWTPFANAQIRQNEEGCLTIISPYIKDPAGFATGDLVEIKADGKFILKGRADSIVKIEEKRISLAEVENRLMQSGLVSECCVVEMSDRRQYLAAAIVLNEEGKQKFAETEKYLINRYFHDWLLRFFENVVLPKKWRFLDSLPSDAQGKRKKPVVQRLFAPENIHGIPAETVMNRSENEVELEVEIPAASDYFNDHFPQFKLLPAVAQVDLVAHFAQRYFGTEVATVNIKRFKFSDKIFPNTTVVFKLNYDSDKKTVTFSIRDLSGTTIYAAGTYDAAKN